MSCSLVGNLQVAEADGNRTRQRARRPLVGFEDRGAHQNPDASVPEDSGVGPGAVVGVADVTSRRRRSSDTSR